MAIRSSCGETERLAIELLGHVARAYLDKHGPITFRQCNSTDGNGVADAIVVHGMLATCHLLNAFGNAIASRASHRKVWLANVAKNQHYYLPQITTQATAQLVADGILRNIDASRICTPVDLIGHSNGGYVVSHLTNILPAGVIRNVITRGNPHGSN